MAKTITAILADRVKHAGANPLLTYYDLIREERTELSAKTFANWVDKTVNLLDDLGESDEPNVFLDFSERVGHWVWFVWATATWQVGGRIIWDLTNQPDVQVGGPSSYLKLDPSMAVTVACSLHPFGLAFDPPLAEDIVDYAQVLAQPDVHWDNNFDTTSLTNIYPESSRICLPVGNLEARFVNKSAGLSEPDMDTKFSNPKEILRKGLVEVLLGGGSTVIIKGGSKAQASQVAEKEKATLILPS